MKKATEIWFSEQFGSTQGYLNCKGCGSIFKKQLKQCPYCKRLNTSIQITK